MNSEHKQTNGTATTRSHLSRSLVSSLGSGGALPSDPSFCSSLTLAGVGYYPHRPTTPAPVSLTTELCMQDFDEDTARDAWLERLEADGLTVDEYIELCPKVAGK